MDMTPYQLKLLTSNGWIEKYQPLTIDMTKDTYTGLYRVGLIFLFIPETRAFHIFLYDYLSERN